MTSGEKVQYKGMFDCGAQVIKSEGVPALFKGAGANILRGVAGALVLSMYDKLQEVRTSISSTAQLTDNESETNRLSSERSTLEDPLNLVQKCVNLILLTLMVILDRYRIYYYCYYYIISSSFVLCQSFSKGPNSYSSSFLTLLFVYAIQFSFFAISSGPFPFF
jgi:hypothetical protein